MLVLSRKIGEKIFIVDTLTGERIEVACLRLGALGVRLGIEASTRFNIVREELTSDGDTESEGVRTGHQSAAGTRALATYGQ